MSSSSSNEKPFLRVLSFNLEKQHTLAPRRLLSSATHLARKTESRYKIVINDIFHHGFSNPLSIGALMKQFLPRTYKNNKFLYYSSSAAQLLLPRPWLIKQCQSILQNIPSHDAEYIQARVNYYNQLENSFQLDQQAATTADLSFLKSSAYTLDMLAVLRYFPPTYRFYYEYGDVTHIPPQPTFVKSRPIHGNNTNSILLKLNKVRHYNFLRDPMPFDQKKPLLIWRGAARQPHRKLMMAALFEHPLCDIGQTNSSEEHPQWQCPVMSIREQLNYKYLLCIEGNDVASNLKWAMSSNSLCLMTKPKFETWFMEGRLVAGKHYVELDENYSNVEEKISYYNQHPDQAQAIVSQAQHYVSQFKQRRRELQISLLVLDKYFNFSEQTS